MEDKGKDVTYFLQVILLIIVVGLIFIIVIDRIQYNDAKDIAQQYCITNYGDEFQYYGFSKKLLTKTPYNINCINETSTVLTECVISKFL